MLKASPPLRRLFGLPIVQYAWVVRDLQAAMKTWTHTFGLGPFYTALNVQLSGVLYRGEPGGTHHSLAMAQAGEGHIELIEVHSPPPHVYADLLGEGGAGFHHVAVLADDYDGVVGRLQAEGIELAVQHQYRDTRVCYADTSSSLGFYVEVLEETQLLKGLLARVREGCETWDGMSEPVRVLDPG